MLLRPSCWKMGVLLWHAALRTIFMVILAYWYMFILWFRHPSWTDHLAASLPMCNAARRLRIVVKGKWLLGMYEFIMLLTASIRHSIPKWPGQIVTPWGTERLSATVTAYWNWTGRCRYNYAKPALSYWKVFPPRTRGSCANAFVNFHDLLSQYRANHMWMLRTKIKLSQHTRLNLHCEALRHCEYTSPIG